MAEPCWLAAAPVDVTNSPSATKPLSGTPTPVEPAGGGTRSSNRNQRVLQSSDFRRVYDHGVRIPGPLFAAFCLARPAEESADGPRLGLTVPRAVGKAVIRNRIKRRLREVFRAQRAGLDAKWDIVLNPRRQAAEAPFVELEAAFRKVIDRCKR